MKPLKNIFNKIRNYKNKIYNTPSRKSGNKFVLYKADGTIVKNPSIPNSVIAGIPAKVVKTGITWDRDNTHYYNLKHMKE